ncbi:hypothetical protein BTUL_0022g00250 [Botrytis tulipae]|uniref:Uncharacterized protein n=1 Tax=Botrytis tulipae TaxID=87230 RepID=A0A4Z1EWY0_9HELO|nr:hypothetical protein BTUL_0022g00250 [Botrytis tulipae]
MIIAIEQVMLHILKPADQYVPGFLIITCIQPENRKRVPDSDCDDSDCEVRSEIDERNHDFSDNGDSTEPQERPDINRYTQGSSAQDYRGSNESFDGGSYTEAVVALQDTASDVAMSRFHAEDPDSAHHNKYTVRDPSHEPLRYGMLKSSVNSYATIVEHRDDNTTIQPSIT